MTPHELMLAVEVYNRKNAIKTREMLTHAYLTAYWQRIDRRKFPRFKSVLDKVKIQERPRTQTPEQMLAIAKMIHQRMQEGGG